MRLGLVDQSVSVGDGPILDLRPVQGVG